MRRKMWRKPSRALTSTNRGVTFTRSFWSSNWAFDPATLNGFWRVFRPSFSDIPNYIDYRSLFDMYKVTKVTVTLHPRITMLTQPQNSGTGPASNQMYVTYATDTEHDFAYNPSGTYQSTNYNSFLERMGSRAKTRVFNKPVKFTFKPRIIDDFGGGFTMKPCPWLNSSIMSTVLYGAHVWLHDYAFGALNAQQFGADVQYTLHFACKGQN